MTCAGEDLDRIAVLVAACRRHDRAAAAALAATASRAALEQVVLLLADPAEPDVRQPAWSPK